MKHWFITLAYLMLNYLSPDIKMNILVTDLHKSGSPAALNNLQFHWTLVSRSSIVFRARVHCFVVWCIVFSAESEKTL